MTFYHLPLMIQYIPIAGALSFSPHTIFLSLLLSCFIFLHKLFFHSILSSSLFKCSFAISFSKDFSLFFPVSLSFTFFFNLHTLQRILSHFLTLHSYTSFHFQSFYSSFFSYFLFFSLFFLIPKFNFFFNLIYFIFSDFLLSFITCIVSFCLSFFLFCLNLSTGSIFYLLYFLLFFSLPDNATSHNILEIKKKLTLLRNSPVGSGCRIHRLHPCRRVRPPPMGVLDMTLNNLMVRFQQWGSFRECGAPLHCHLSQVHSGLER